MNVNVTIVAPELVGALNNLANAFGNNPLAGVAINTDSKVFTADKKIEEPKAEKAEPAAKEKVGTPKQETKQPDSEPTPDPEPEKEEKTSGITLDMITTKTREFIQANPANRVKLKEFLEEKGAPKVSELQPADYQAALDFFEAQAK